MRSVHSVTVVTLCSVWIASQAHAATGALCIKKTLNGSLKLRATGVCKSTEIQIGSFDGTTLQFSGINVQVVSGSGATEGTVNGKGNLIVGYNESGLCLPPMVTACNTDADCGTNGPCTPVSGARSGSHNFVIGPLHTFPSYGGLVAGYQNIVSGPFASVSGGSSNAATAMVASVSGGQCNIAGPGSYGTCAVFSGAGMSISGGSGLTEPADDGWAAGSGTPANTISGDFKSP